MKKLICLLLCAVLVAGCARVQAADLMAGVQPNKVTPSGDLSAEASAVTDFSLRLFQQSMTEGENTLISPLSVLLALSMTANGADGETLAQMEQVLGLPSETLNRWLHAYMSGLPDGLSAANSIWFKDESRFTVVPEFLQTNADYYGADIYKAPFDSRTLKDINNWVEDETDGMIRDLLDRIPEEAVMYLINVLAFEAEWTQAYKGNQVRSGVFTREDGTEQSAELMHSEEHQYLEDDRATGFIKYYKGRNYAFVALLPKEGVTVAEYVNGLTGEQLQALLSEPESRTVLAAIPKFESGSQIEMSGTLEDMGMTDAFDWAKADFSRLGSYEGLNLCIGRVLHKTYISVAEQGTKAGAATAVEVNAEGAMEPMETKVVTLDRPFVYFMIDCENNVPIFIGTMMDVQ